MTEQTEIKECPIRIRADIYELLVLMANEADRTYKAELCRIIADEYNRRAKKLEHTKTN